MRKNHISKNSLSTIEAAKILNISRQAVLKKIHSGIIKADKVGKKYVVKREDLPIESGGKLTGKKKELLEKAVQKTVKEYGNTLRLLGNE